MHRRAFSRAIGAALCVLASAAAFAQGYPSRPVTLVSPFPAGSGSDLTARAVSPALAEALGQPVVVDNKPGAGGAIGAAAVARARPDGYTLLLASLSFSVLPALMELTFDPARDFEAVTLMGQQGMAIVVPPALPAASMADFVAMARSKPGAMNYASAGTGSIGHLAGELLKTERGVSIVHVPFKGTPEALMAVMSGEVQMALVSMPAVEPQVKAGKVKALAVTGTRRDPSMPDVPTLVEAGFPALSDSVWYAILVPAGTPKDIIALLNAAFRKAVTNPAAVERLTGAAKTLPASSTPEEATAYVRAQIAKWTGVAQQAGLKPQR